MAVIIINVAPEGVTPEEYKKVTEILEAQGSPDGNIFHTGFIRDGRIMIIDAWESREKYEAFAESRLGPAIAQVMGDRMAQMGPPPAPEVLDPLDLNVP